MIGNRFDIAEEYHRFQIRTSRKRIGGDRFYRGGNNYFRNAAALERTEPDAGDPLGNHYFLSFQRSVVGICLSADSRHLFSVRGEGIGHIENIVFSRFQLIGGRHEDDARALAVGEHLVHAVIVRNGVVAVAASRSRDFDLFEGIAAGKDVGSHVLNVGLGIHVQSHEILAVCERAGAEEFRSLGNGEFGKRSAIFKRRRAYGNARAFQRYRFERDTVIERFFTDGLQIVVENDFLQRPRPRKSRRGYAACVVVDLFNARSAEYIGV